MRLEELLESLCLPSDSRVDKRIPKKVFVENATFASSDRKVIHEDIDEIYWIAALKPSNIGVLAYKDSVREYLEIAILSVKLRSNSKIGKIAQLIHRTVPYPVLLALETMDGLYLSVAHKRWAQGNAERFVVEELEMANCLLTESGFDKEFLESLCLSNVPRSNLFALYQGWILSLECYSAALLTGEFKPPSAWQDCNVLKSKLALHSKISCELNSLKNKVTREKQLNRRVQLNNEIKRCESDLAAIRMDLMESHPSDKII